MLSIFICDNDPIQREHLEQTIANYTLLEHLNAKLVLSTDDPKEILLYLKKHPKTSGLYFLEVNLQREIDGFTLASDIREIDLHGHIVFVTAHSELTLMTFSMKIEALDYIIKGRQYDKIKERILNCLDVAYQRYVDTQLGSREIFQANVKGKLQFYPINEIMFFETSQTTKHWIVLHLTQDSIEFRYSLKEVEHYNRNFVRVHSSYVLNVQNIEYIDGKNMEVKMKNGAFCRLSARGLQTLKKRLDGGRTKEK
ncbi:MAG: LytTR family DNA-binding domain-containing protein [Lachnospiraceae bacterium]|nr:LytTR family DNA-binding domain-containing protein [Lachnospiraceae bacterium]